MSSYHAFAMTGMLFLASAGALPCTCDWQRTGWDAKDSLRKAKAVFLGEVTSVTAGKVRDSDLGGSHVYVEFHIEKYWKGVKGQAVGVWALVPLACGGPSYRIGESYLVYAYGYGKELETSGCARSRHRKDADQDLAILGKGKIPKSKQSKSQ